MIAIIFEEIFQRFLHLGLAGIGTEDAANQHRRAVSHIGVDALVIERRHTHVRAGGVGGVCQIELGIDQGAIQVEDEEIHFHGGGYALSRSSCAVWSGCGRRAPRAWCEPGAD